MQSNWPSRGRRRVYAFLGTLAAGAIFAATSTAAETYPDKQIRLIVAYAPGGGADSLARLLAQRLTASLKQPVVVENRAGASGIIGSDFVARSTPDGYTLLLVSTTQLITAKLYPHVPFDLSKSFTPVAYIGSTPLILVVNNALPVHNLNELTALASKRQINYASPGSGSAGHLSMEMIKSKEHVPMVHVPYKGTGPAMTDLLGGHVDAMMDILPSSLPYVKAGQLRALAVTSAKRYPDLPNVPTIAEAGLKGYEATNWYGVLAPAGTPASVVDTLHKAIRQQLEDPATKDWLKKQSYTESDLSNADFSRLIQKDGALWAQAIQESGAKPD